VGEGFFECFGAISFGASFAALAERAYFALPCWYLSPAFEIHRAPCFCHRITFRTAERIDDEHFGMWCFLKLFDGNGFPGGRKRRPPHIFRIRIFGLFLCGDVLRWMDGDSACAEANWWVFCISGRWCAGILLIFHKNHDSVLRICARNLFFKVQDEYLAVWEIVLPDVYLAPVFVAREEEDGHERPHQILAVGGVAEVCQRYGVSVELVYALPDNDLPFLDVRPCPYVFEMRDAMLLLGVLDLLNRATRTVRGEELRSMASRTHV
jgi:hypothetical protein